MSFIHLFQVLLTSFVVVLSHIHECWPETPSNSAYNHVDFRAGGGSASNRNNYERSPDSTNPEFYLGKDRELVHFTVDLKWIWMKLMDKQTYINFLSSTWKMVTSLTGLVDGNSSQDLKEIAVDILSYMRSVNPDTPIKLFHGSISRAKTYAATTNRLLLVYVEVGRSKTPSRNSIQFRQALADADLGRFINEEVRLTNCCNITSTLILTFSAFFYSFSLPNSTCFMQEQRSIEIPAVSSRLCSREANSRSWQQSLFLLLNQLILHTNNNIRTAQTVREKTFLLPCCGCQ